MSGHRVPSDAYLADYTYPDPGDTEKLLSHGRDRICYPIVTAAAETRTLPDPLKPGVQMSIWMDTDGGDCVITADTAINETGNNTITLDDAGEFLMLQSISLGSSYVWRPIATDGAGLSTV